MKNRDKCRIKQDQWVQDQDQDLTSMHNSNIGTESSQFSYTAVRVGPRSVT